MVGNQDMKQRIKEAISNNEVSVVDDNEEFIIVCADDDNKKPIIGRLGDSIYILQPEQIIYFEAEGNDCLCITSKSNYYVKEKIYQIEGLLSEERFLRVSRFHVVNMNKIKSIKPSQNLKFELMMINNSKINVTRSYYYIFKEFLGI